MSAFKGNVKWFNNARGYGFIGREGSPDVFCHFSAIIQDGYKKLKDGELVEFEIAEGATGRQEARRVKPLSQVSEGR